MINIPDYNNDTLKFGKNIIIFIAHIFSIPIVMLIRRNFGERYFNLITVILYASGIYLFIIKFDQAAVKVENFWQIIIGLLLVAACYHQWCIYRRNKLGIQLHSYFAGEMLPIFNILPISDANKALYIEPIFVAFGGLFLDQLVTDGSGSFFGAWCFTAGHLMFISKYLLQQRGRGLYLDAVDAQIQADFMKELLENKPSLQTQKTFRIAGVSDVSDKKRSKMVQALRQTSSA